MMRLVEPQKIEIPRRQDHFLVGLSPTKKLKVTKTTSRYRHMREHLGKTIEQCNGLWRQIWSLHYTALPWNWWKKTSRRKQKPRKEAKSLCERFSVIRKNAALQNKMLSNKLFVLKLKEAKTKTEKKKPLSNDHDHENEETKQKTEVELTLFDLVNKGRSLKEWVRR